jgi:hypothetical protein
VTGGAAALERIARLVGAARRIADRNDVLGREARARLPEATGLSPHNVDLGLRHCLEVRPTDQELHALYASVGPASAVHVLLSANVFVAAHRALALALASSAHVAVRSSRREPVMAELLDRAAPGLFSIVEELSPRAGDHVWAYGRDETLTALRGSLPAGCVLHGHGAGFGVAVVDEETHGTSVDELSEAVARDVSLFDQRGCLSPRVLLYMGSERAFKKLSRRLAAALDDAEATCPRGWLDASEISDARRVADTLLMGGSLVEAGKGWIGLVSEGGATMLPPPGRHLVMARTESPVRWIEEHRGAITTVGCSVSESTRASLAEALPLARLSEIGAMQSPPFDGPVDRRTQPAGEVVGR